LSQMLIFDLPPGFSESYWICVAAYGKLF